MIMITREQKCKAIVLACGGHWHEWEWIPSYEGGEDLRCKICGVEKTKANDNPTFHNPADLLKLMMTRSDWDSFKWEIGYEATTGHSTLTYEKHEYIDVRYILDPDKLVDKAFEWVRKCTS
jgi:hypothetical protein